MKPTEITSGVEKLTGNPKGNPIEETFSVLTWVRSNQVGCTLEISTLYCMLVILWFKGEKRFPFFPKSKVPLFSKIQTKFSMPVLDSLLPIPQVSKISWDLCVLCEFKSDNTDSIPVHMRKIWRFELTTNSKNINHVIQWVSRKCPNIRFYWKRYSANQGITDTCLSDHYPAKLANFWIN